MTVKDTKIEGVYLITLDRFGDERGALVNNFVETEFEKHGLKFTAKQSTRSLTAKAGTVRGLHFQTKPKEVAKLVQCTRGAIYDVAVDLRADSNTFGAWLAYELKADLPQALLIPEGCAHGFQTLTDDCEVLYFMSEAYDPAHAKGVRWDDPALKISWPLETAIISEQDRKWSLLER